MSQQISLEPRDRAYAWRLLVTVLFGNIAFGSTMTIIGASLSDISESLGTTNTTLAWAVTAPFLSLAASTTLFGTLGDSRGHRPVLIAGLVLFTAATGLSGLAWNAFSLIAFRVLVGVGGAMMFPNAAALVIDAFGVRHRARALGWMQFASTGGPAIGLVTGGALVDAFGWRAIFLVYTPIAAIGLVSALVVVRPGPRGEARPVDRAGAMSLVTAVVAFMVWLDRATDQGFADPVALVAVVMAPLAVAGFVAVEHRGRHPMVPLAWFRHPNFAGPIVASATAHAAYMGGFVLAPQLLQERYGYTLTAATAFLVIRLASFSLISPVGGHLTAIRNERWTATLGTGLVLVSMAALAAGSTMHAVALVIVGLALSGAGLGLGNPAYTVSVAGAVPPDKLGAATGMFQTFTSLGTAVGIQVLVLASGDQASGSGFATAFWVGAAVTLVGLTAAAAIRPVSHKHLTDTHAA